MTAEKPLKAEKHGAVLVVEDDLQALAGLRLLLDEDFEVWEAESAGGALRVLEDQSIDVVLTDYEMPNGTGLSLLAGLKLTQPGAIGVLMTAHATYPDVLAARGDTSVFRVVLKPLDPEALLGTLRSAAHLSRMRRSVRRLPRR